MISDIIEHWYHMWNSIVIATNLLQKKRMICSLMFIINNHYGLKCLNNLLQLEPCNVMFTVISDIMAHCYDLWSTIVIKCLSNQLQLEPCNVMFKVISDIMAYWWNTIVIAINFFNAKQMIWALMFIISNHYGIKCLSNQLQLEPCYVMFKVFSNIMAHRNYIWNSKWFVHLFLW